MAVALPGHNQTKHSTMNTTPLSASSIWAFARRRVKISIKLPDGRVIEVPPSLVPAFQSLLKLDLRGPSWRHIPGFEKSSAAKSGAAPGLGIHSRAPGGQRVTSSLSYVAGLMRR